MPVTRLKGKFVECCDCYTVCPCWVSEKADDGHCTGLYAWAFADDAEIAGVSLKNKVVAAASYHGRRRVTQSILFLGSDLAEEQKRRLEEVFTGKGASLTEAESKKFHALRSLLGEIIAVVPATVTASNMNANWSITVKSDGQVLASAEGVDRVIPNRTAPITVRDTALDKQMGVDGAVRVQHMDRLEIAIAALPGEPFVYVGRAGMAGQFNYSK